MTYHQYRRWGESDDKPSVEQMRQALGELDVKDDEHPDTWLTHESGWTLSAHSDGLLVWENLEGGEPMHMRGISRDRILELWIKLSRGEISSIAQEPWAAGYGHR